MLPAFVAIDGPQDALLLICDHASARVPADIDLGIPPHLYAEHIAIDIGAEPLTRALAAALGAPAVLGRWSRLVADCNRPEDSPQLAPPESDGHPIPGNMGLSAGELAARRAIHRDFHACLDGLIGRQPPRLMVSIHSFTPMLSSAPTPRPWPVAVLWNRDDRAARIALRLLADHPDIGGPVGANEPYSGQTLNYTMDRHAEDRGIPSLGFEVRQDEIATPAGVARWAAILTPVIAASLAAMETPA